MSIRAEKSWSVHCDFPGCDHQFEYADYSIFGDGWDAEEIVTESDGWLGTDGKHYCDNHSCAWASDPVQVAATIPPYLLIHDGDTPDECDDRKVTLILPGGAR